MPRNSQACDACKSRKVKCDRTAVCQQCKNLSLRCTYTVRPKPDRRRTKRGAIIALYRSGCDRQDDPPTLYSPPSLSASLPLPSPSTATSSPISFDQRFFKNVLTPYTQNIYPMFPIIPETEIFSSIDLLHADRNQSSFLYAMAAVTVGHAGVACKDLVGISCDADRSKIIDALVDKAIELRGAMTRSMTIDVRNILTAVMLSSSLVGLHNVELAWLYLREAITMATILRLHDFQELQSFDLSERARRQRLFWMLFIHERFMAIHFYRPVILAPVDVLPENDPSISENVQAGFTQIIKLFRLVDSNFINGYLSTSSSISQSWLEQKQNEIKSSTTELGGLSEMQQVDLIITQQWLRVMVWQMAMSRYLLSVEISEGFMSLLFPVEIARKIRKLISTVSEKSIQVHGCAIIHKLFELAITIADVVACIPLDHAEEMSGSYKDFVWIAKFLLNQPSIEPAQKALLQGKLDILNNRLIPSGEVMSHSEPSLGSLSPPPDAWQSIAQSLGNTVDANREIPLVPLIPHLGSISEFSQELLNEMDLAYYSTTN